MEGHSQCYGRTMGHTTIEGEMEALTDNQLIDILHSQSIKIRRLENIVLIMAEGLKEQSEFLTTEILKARLDLKGKDNKTPYKKVLGLEEQLKGFIEYYNKNRYEKKGKGKFTEYTDDSVNSVNP